MAGRRLRKFDFIFRVASMVDRTTHRNNNLLCGRISSTRASQYSSIFISKLKNYFQLSFHHVNQTIDRLIIVLSVTNGTSRQRQAMVIG